MGCGSSTAVHGLESEFDAKTSNRDVLSELGLHDDDFHKIYSHYRRLVVKNRSGDGKLDFYAFLDNIGLGERRKIAKRAFKVIDANGDGVLTFREFLLGVWVYCTHDHDALIRFAFHMFDDDKSGRLEMNELSSIVHEVYGHSKRDKNHSAALRKLTKYAHVNNKVKTVSEHDFLLLVKSAPALLFPVFRLQQQLQSHVVGKAYWKKAARRRAQHGISTAQWLAKIERLLSKDTSRYVSEKWRQVEARQAPQQVYSATSGGAAGTGAGSRRRSQQQQGCQQADGGSSRSRSGSSSSSSSSSRRTSGSSRRVRVVHSKDASAEVRAKANSSSHALPDMRQRTPSSHKLEPLPEPQRRRAGSSRRVMPG